MKNQIFNDFQEGVGYTVPQGTLRGCYKLRSADSSGNRELVQVGNEDINEIIQSSYTSSLDYMLDRFLDGDSVLSSEGSPVDMTDDFLLDALDVSAAYVENMEAARETYEFPSDWSYEQIRVALNDKLKKIESEVINNGTQTQNSAPQTVEQSEE